MLKKFEACKQGRIFALRRFISRRYDATNLSRSYSERTLTLEWNSKFQKAFEDVKRYLLNPSVLSPPVPGRPLLLYISCTDFSIGWMCFRPDGHWYKAIYYLSQTLVGYEMKYSPLPWEKTCLALVFATQKLRHYIICYVGPCSQTLGSYGSSQIPVWEASIDRSNCFYFFGVWDLLCNPESH